MHRKPIPQRRPVARKAVTLREPPRLAATSVTARALQQRASSLPSPRLPPAAVQVADARANPYVDYARHFTPEGGIAITYKDIDDRLRWTILRWSLWSAAMALTGWYAFAASPLSLWFNLPALAVMGCVYWLIVGKHVEIYRRVEVRPDCLIIHETDVFFREEMESWPSFQPDAERNLVLTGILGTRWVEYLKVPRFDEFDRAPEVFTNHLRAAMQQLWSYPSRGLG